MAFSLTIADYAVAVFILLVPIAIGILYAVKDANKLTRDEYLLGGRQMSILPVATSLFISFISGISMIGIPAEVFYFGFIYFLHPLGHTLSYLVGSITIVPLMHPLQITSIYEYLKLRYKSDSLRIMSSVLGVLAQICYMTVCMLSPALALQACADIPLWISILLLGAMGTIYTAIGGIKSVIWTDAFQSFIAYFGVIVIFAKACIEVGGLGQVWKIAEEGGRVEFDKFSIDPRVRHTVWSLTFGLAFNRLNLSFNQSTLQRISCMKSLREAKIMYLLNIPMTLVFDAAMALVGLAIYAYFASKFCDPYEADLISNRNQISPYFVMYAMNDMPGMAGLFVAFLCCGSLSTLSSGINSLAANTVEDILHRPLRNVQESRMTLITKVVSGLYGALIVGLTYLSTSFKGPVNQMVGTAIGALGSPITGVFLVGGAVPWVNKFGAVAGVLSSLVYNLVVSVGSIISGIYFPALPSVGDEGCYNSTLAEDRYLQTSNSTITSQAASSPQDGSPDKFFLYAISYEWYSVMGVVVCVIVCLFVSYITNKMIGGSDEVWKSTDSRFVFPVVRRFWDLELEERKSSKPNCEMVSTIAKSDGLAENNLKHETLKWRL